MDHPLILLFSVIAGAAIQELFWWYNIRHKLTLKRYKNLIRSRGYWLTSFAMVFATAAGVMLWKRETIENYEMVDFFVFGVAIPILIKELISIAGKKERKIGAYSSSSINSYFLMGIRD